MNLTDRSDFEKLREKAESDFQRSTSGDRWVVSIGISECSIAKGAEETHEHLRLQIESQGLDIALRRVGCGGWCWAEPFVTVVGPSHPQILYGSITSDVVPELIEAIRHGNVLASHAVGTFSEEGFDNVPPLSNDQFFGRQRRILSEHWGQIDPCSIEEYIANGGYSAWTRALFDMTPDEVIEEVKASGVRGRGGAGFPAGIKWESGRRAKAEPKFMACNSHEGEPNVYKDRRLIESNPHVVLEGIMLGCYGVGAERGYNYVGGEHKLAVARFNHAVKQAYEYGILGDDILGSGTNCHIRGRAGAGAYIAGEGSSLMYSIMGERSQPRTKPPRSVEEGLWGRPTVLNNTETIAPIPAIIRNGGEWYAEIGTERNAGTKLITMQGPLARLGVVEIEMGFNLRELIFDVYGGMADGYKFKGVQTGGVSAGCLTEKQLDVGVDFDSMKPYDAMLGSGGFVIFDESVSAVEFARYLMDFNRWESCSKCTPCRLGNPALVEVVDRLLNGMGRPGDIELIERTSKHIMQLSLCGLGQVAPAPLLGMIRAFPEEFEALIKYPEEAVPDRLTPLAAAGS